ADTRKDFALEDEFRPLIAVGIKISHIEPIENLCDVLCAVGDEGLDTLGVKAKSDVDRRPNFAAKLRVKRRINRDFLCVGKLEFEARHLPLDQPHRLTGE